MIPLIIAIILLCISILITRQFLQISEWYLWACMLINTYLREVTDDHRIKILRIAGKKRFPIVLRMIPKHMFQAFIQYAQKDLKDNDNSMKNYNRLIQGIALYDKDYTFLLRLIEDEGKQEKA